MQAYRGMDIGTAKPEAGLRASLPHHLVDILEPSELYSVGDFVRRAGEAVAAIRARGRLPIVSGGTGFYVKHLVGGLPTAPAADPALRAEVARDLEARGVEALRAELASGDPVSAARIHERDLYRLSRALEILRATGRPLADFLPAGGGEGWQVIEYRRPREELRSRIALRVDGMFEAGLPAEVARLREAGFGAGDPGMKAIGYSEFFELEADGLSGEGLLVAARARIKADSQKYAKRQETFFKGLPGRLVLEAKEGGPEGLAEILRPWLER